MSQLKPKAGKSYKIIHHNGEETIVSFTYNCPYCLRETNVRRNYTAGRAILEGKAFFLELICNHCGETAEVRYLPHQRIIESEDTV